MSAYGFVSKGFVSFALPSLLISSIRGMEKSTPISHLLKLTLLTHWSGSHLENYLDFISRCVEWGVSCVQMRQKSLTYSERFTFGKRLQQVLKPFGVPLIVNDDLDLCLAIESEGVHLGQTDGDVSKARYLLGENRIIGLSVNDLSQVRLANHLPINYIGVGSVFPTKNKPNVQTIWGIEGLQTAVSESSHPVIAIGGINATNGHLVMETGSHGIAAIDAFHQSKNCEITIKTLRQIVEQRTPSC